MFHDMVLPPEQSPMEQVSSSLLNPQLIEFCDWDLFQEITIPNPEVSSGCHKDQQSSSPYVVINPSIPPYITKSPTPVDNTTAASTTAAINNDLSLMFGDKITPLDLSNASHFANDQYPLCNQEQFDMSLLQSEDQINDPIFSYLCAPSTDHVVPLIGPKTLLKLCEEDIISPIPPSPPSKFMLSSNYHFADPSINSNLLPMSSSTECDSLYLGNEIQIHGNNNGTCYSTTDHLQQSINSNNLQAFSNEDQHLVNGCGSSTIPLTSDITGLESESLRVVTNKLTSEERKEKINKYMKKRNERNFNKKIKYACRKTLADSRPRVRGRFAKHDDFGENNRTNNNHEEDTDEDEVVKEEENFESSDILAHISGVNSFKRKYSIQSWI